MPNLSHKILLESLAYNPETGDFYWLAKRAKWGNGAVAGYTTKRGYISIAVKPQKYQAHRLAWFYMTGAWPKDQIDHINGIRHDNRWANLREVTGSVNQQNRKFSQRNNKLGVLGVSPWGCRFKARIDGKHLGCYDSAELAHSAYVEAKRNLHAGNTL